MNNIPKSRQFRITHSTNVILKDVTSSGAENTETVHSSPLGFLLSSSISLIFTILLFQDMWSVHEKLNEEISLSAMKKLSF